jgi:hypothetical protein
MKYRYYGKKYRAVPIIDSIVHTASRFRVLDDPKQFVSVEYQFIDYVLLAETDIPKSVLNNRLEFDGVLCSVEKIVQEDNAIHYYTSYNSDVELFTEEEFQNTVNRILEIANNKQNNIIDFSKYKFAK